MANKRTDRSAEHPALRAVRESGTGKVKVAVSDIDGILRGKLVVGRKLTRDEMNER
jgi:glutamine synthetase